MSNFNFLKEYVKGNGGEQNLNTKHNLYLVDNNEILKAEEKLGYVLPVELSEFYKQVGYGFFHKKEKYEIDRFMSPLQVAQINLKEDFYANDPDLEDYDELYKGEKMLFFEVNEGIYLAIDKNEFEGKNPIYYFDKKIFNSLEQFLIEFDKDPHLLSEIEE